MQQILNQAIERGNVRSTGGTDYRRSEANLSDSYPFRRKSLGRIGVRTLGAYSPVSFRDLKSAVALRHVSRFLILPRCFAESV